MSSEEVTDTKEALDTYVMTRWPYNQQTHSKAYIFGCFQKWSLTIFKCFQSRSWYTYNLF